MLPALAGSTFSIFNFFQKNSLKTQLEHGTFKKVLPARARSTLSIFTYLQVIAISVHIEFAVFKKCLPSERGAHFLLFSTSHDITKNMQIEFVGISSLLECLLGPLGIALGWFGVVLESTLRQIGPTCGQFYTNLCHPGLNLGTANLKNHCFPCGFFNTF